MLQEANIVQDWINEGIEKGEVKAIRNDILDVLGERFGVVKKGIGIRLAAIDDPAVLRSLLKKSVKVKSLAEFIRLLEEVEN
jgi:hypothetical protein